VWRILESKVTETLLQLLSLAVPRKDICQSEIKRVSKA